MIDQHFNMKQMDVRWGLPRLTLCINDKNALGTLSGQNARIRGSVVLEYQCVWGQSTCKDVTHHECFDEGIAQIGCLAIPVNGVNAGAASEDTANGKRIFMTTMLMEVEAWSFGISDDGKIRWYTRCPEQLAAGDYTTPSLASFASCGKDKNISITIFLPVARLENSTLFEYLWHDSVYAWQPKFDFINTAKPCENIVNSEGKEDLGVPVGIDYQLDRVQRWLVITEVIDTRLRLALWRTRIMRHRASSVPPVWLFYTFTRALGRRLPPVLSEDGRLAGWSVAKGQGNAFRPQQEATPKLEFTELLTQCSWAFYSGVPSEPSWFLVLCPNFSPSLCFSFSFGIMGPVFLLGSGELDAQGFSALLNIEGMGMSRKHVRPGSITQQEKNFREKGPSSARRFWTDQSTSLFLSFGRYATHWPTLRPLSCKSLRPSHGLLDLFWVLRFSIPIGTNPFFYLCFELYWWIVSPVPIQRRSDDRRFETMVILAIGPRGVPNLQKRILLRTHSRRRTWETSEDKEGVIGRDGKSLALKGIGFGFASERFTASVSYHSRQVPIRIRARTSSLVPTAVILPTPASTSPTLDAQSASMRNFHAVSDRSSSMPSTSVDGAVTAADDGAGRPVGYRLTQPTKDSRMPICAKSELLLEMMVRQDRCNGSGANEKGGRSGNRNRNQIHLLNGLKIAHRVVWVGLRPRVLPWPETPAGVTKTDIPGGSRWGWSSPCEIFQNGGRLRGMVHLAARYLWSRTPPWNDAEAERPIQSCHNRSPVEVVGWTVVESRTSLSAPEPVRGELAVGNVSNRARDLVGVAYGLPCHRQKPD
ncbi:hypothetical protein P691DRAFT_782358 [Macrolepiota fuliginosa MF-IS2]|uniref:Uncharacterized protein n=1 Tax=Macrolepiota fuliginosa MF-IS2 TaxID=1400762 RepID=A0A9P5XA06_9AGAR|nr:hypothetical protein P691DRAFT_782358 [Macrolepiota fuliginosa MF-IS2]